MLAREHFPPSCSTFATTLKQPKVFRQTLLVVIKAIFKGKNIVDCLENFRKPTKEFSPINSFSCKYVLKMFLWTHEKQFQEVPIFWVVLKGLLSRIYCAKRSRLYSSLKWSTGPLSKNVKNFILIGTMTIFFPLIKNLSSHLILFVPLSE